MPWMNGHSVSALLVAGKETAEIVHRAGRALALLHDELRDAEPSAAFRSVRRKLLLPPGPVGAVRAVRSVVDFTPYNMLVDDSGILSISTSSRFVPRSAFTVILRGFWAGTGSMAVRNRKPSYPAMNGRPVEPLTVTTRGSWQRS